MKTLPEKARKVFSGILFDTYQWDQELFNGSTATFECVKKTDSNEIIVVVGDNILIQKQRQPARSPFISIPGGNANLGETDMLASAKRELLEETGYVSKDWELLKAEDTHHKIVSLNYRYIARNAQKAAEPHLDSGEQIENILISFDEFLLLSEEPTFQHKELALFLYYLRLHPEDKNVLKKKLFG